MKKRLMVVGLLLLLLTGCSNVTGQSNFEENISTIEAQLNHDDWRNLHVQANNLNKLYENQQWKLQLLGDEGEYEELKVSINRLKKAIEEKDKTQAKLELATIQAIISDIYSL